MKKRSEYVPLELSGQDLEAFIEELKDKLYSEFWSSEQDDSRKAEIKNLIGINIYQALDNIMK